MLALLTNRDKKCSFESYRVPCNCGRVQPAGADNFAVGFVERLNTGMRTLSRRIVPFAASHCLRAFGAKLIVYPCEIFPRGRLGTEPHVKGHHRTPRRTYRPQHCDGSFAFNSRVPASVVSSHLSGLKLFVWDGVIGHPSRDLNGHQPGFQNDRSNRPVILA
jgi:hypothetical protein